MKIGNKVRVITKDAPQGKYHNLIGEIVGYVDNEYPMVKFDDDTVITFGKDQIEEVKRYFACVTGYNVNLPQRKTKFSAGYDFEAAERVVIFPQEVKLVPTGVKVYMQPNEYLGLHIRSGTAIKEKLTLINNCGIVDADYADNPDNEGHIMFPIMNLGNSKVVIDKGQRIGQGIFYTYYKTDNDVADGERCGGFGSTSV
jgi:dUTP pyrophosphatase